MIHQNNTCISINDISDASSRQYYCRPISAIVYVERMSEVFISLFIAIDIIRSNTKFTLTTEAYSSSSPLCHNLCALYIKKIEAGYHLA